MLPNTAIAPTSVKLAFFAISFADTPRDLLPTEAEMREFYLGGVAGQLLYKWSMGCLHVDADFYSVIASQNERREDGSCIAEQGLDNLDLLVTFGNKSWPGDYYGTVALQMKRSCTSAGFTGDLEVRTINGAPTGSSFYGIFTSDHAWQLQPTGRCMLSFFFSGGSM
jgi:hypothetical protein